MNEKAREEIIEALKKVEHPEIAVNLVDLGMILDVGVEDNTANIALGFPVETVPAVVRDAVVNSILPVVEGLGYTPKILYFMVPEEDREKFFAAAKANWKGAI